MKRIVFLIIASLLVIGLALPGCGGNGEEGPVTYAFEDDTINIAIAGPMDYIQGIDMMLGAEMVVAELGNPAIAGRNLTINLMQVDTKEIVPPSSNFPELQVESAIVNGADFVIGGFRTEATSGEIEAAMDAKTMYFICGSATTDLLAQVNANYEKYKYLFRCQPVNDTFLFVDCIMMMGMVGYTYLEAISSPNTTDVRVAFLAENLLWTAAPREAVLEAIEGLNFTYMGTQTCSDTADDLSAQMTIIDGWDPTIIFTFLSGPVGITYGKAQGNTATQVAAMTVGINVESQDPGYWDKCVGDANNGADGQITLMTWAPGVNQTVETAPFLSAWETAYPTNPVPIYTASTYDIIKALVLSLQNKATVNTETGNVEVLATDIIAWWESSANAQTTTSGTAGFYTLAHQGLVTAGFPTYAHDLKYGPNYKATGLGVEWINDGGGYGVGHGETVGVWPHADFDEVNQGISDDAFLGYLGLNWTDFTYPGIQQFSFPYWVMHEWGWV